LTPPYDRNIAARDSIIVRAADIAAAAEPVRAADVMLVVVPLVPPLPPPHAKAPCGAMTKSVAGIAKQPKNASLAIEASSRRSVWPYRSSTLVNLTRLDRDCKKNQQRVCAASDASFPPRDDPNLTVTNLVSEEPEHRLECGAIARSDQDSIRSSPSATNR
jgi:hypothetical protein